MDTSIKNKYITTVGLEIHAELRTKTKMFCSSKNNPDEKKPNLNICPICMGYPGTLPVINKEAVKHILKMGIAVGGELADFTEFDRKNYFYPDIPKGYQLSQYKFPLVKGGELHGISLTRIHLEEDTAKSSHDTGDYSLVDFNRAGVPLMELVTEPVIHNAKEASDFAKELQLLLQYLGAGEANMEKGEMRVEANISVAYEDSNVLGTKVEVKNLNSFKAVEKAIEFETLRHIEILEKGEKVIQETRGWDENKEVTFSQRLKEESHDYRYFPDPDLPKLRITEIPEFSYENLKKEMGELPSEKREKYKRDFDLKEKDIEVLISDLEWTVYFEKLTEALKSDKKLVQLAVNYLLSDLFGLIKKEPEFWNRKPIEAGDFAELMGMIAESKINSRAGKDILAIMYKEGGKPEKIAEDKGLLQKNDMGELLKVIKEIVAANPNVVTEYKAGKKASLQFFVGQGMKATRGSANPKILQDLFEQELKG